MPYSSATLLVDYITHYRDYPCFGHALAYAWWMCSSYGVCFGRRRVVVLGSRAVVEMITGVNVCVGGRVVVVVVKARALQGCSSSRLARVVAHF